MDKIGKKKTDINISCMSLVFLLKKEKKKKKHEN